MKTISIRELHLGTGRWVRRAASKERIVITDRGTPVAALTHYDPSASLRSLPDRWNEVKKMPRIPADSSDYVSEMRDRN